MATTQSSTSSNSSSAYTPTTSRYPVHDACEFEDASVLRSLIFVPQSDCDSSDEDEMEDEDDSSSDDGGEASHAQMAYAAAVGRSPVVAAVGGVADLGHSTAAGGAAAGRDVATGGEGEQAASSDNMQIDRETNGNSNAVIENKEGSSKQVSPELLNNQSAVAATNGKEKDNKKSSNKQKRIKYSCPYDLDDRDDDDNTPLHIAIHARKLQHIRLLLEAGASIHRKCDGSAPIHLCIAIGAIGQHAPFALECCQLLLSYGADVTMRDDSFHNPLYLGCTSNLGAVVELLLRDKRVADAVNFKADRVGGRALHAAARYDVGSRRGVVKGGVIPEHQQQQQQKSVTELLLGVEGIEVDAQNNYGRTPLHIAACRGNWNVARLLIQAGADVTIIDKRGFTPGQVARKRGMVLPNDLLVMNQDCQAVVHTRDLIMDPDRTTLILCHELCIQHKTCPPIVRGDAAASEPPPENVRRLTVLINDDDGILRCDEFSTCKWNTDVRRAAMTDVLKVHEYTYIEKTSQLCAAIPDHPNAIQTLDADTTVSHWSFEAALRAAGSVCEAVDKVMSEEFRNAFCAIRPPGHHAGPRGIVTCPNDPDGSHGFCLLNNVAIGAAYARSMYRNDGIKKVAIIDFDVHHGNGTEEIVRQLTPNVEQHMIRTPFAVGGLSTSSYKPWLDENDVNDVFFASTHGYGPRDRQIHPGAVQGGWFYPASGKSYKSKSLTSPLDMETPSLSEFLMSQTWSRLGDEYRLNCCKIIDIGLSLPAKDDSYNHGLQRLELRDSYRKNVIPALLDFDPDMIFISAGFDAHRKDTMNFGYVGMIEEDYEWLTEQLVKVANTCCDGRIVSVLEGGYKIHGGIISPFARSVASHLRGLVDGGSSRETYDREEGEWESQFERHMHDEKEKRRQMKLEKLSRDANIPVASVDVYRQSLLVGARQHDPDDLSHDVSHPEDVSPHHGGGIVDEEPSRKRRRNQVDYAQLYEQMKKEGRGDGI